MLLKVVQAGDECLRKAAKKLSLAQLKSDETQRLIDLMIATLRDKPGVGLAAPQVGEPLQIFIIEDKKKYQKKIPAKVLKAQGRQPLSLKVIINPKLTIVDKTKNRFFEGCLSVEGYRAVVPRYKKVRVSGLDRNGKPVSISADGWLARIIQHEIDHLTGALYIDTMITKSFITEKTFAKEWADALPGKIKTLLDL